MRIARLITLLTLLALAAVFAGCATFCEEPGGWSGYDDGPLGPNEYRNEDGHRCVGVTIFDVAEGFANSGRAP